MSVVLELTLNLVLILAKFNINASYNGLQIFASQ